MPTEDIENHHEEIGEVTFQYFKGKRIKIIKLNTQKIYDLYLEDSKDHTYLDEFL